MTEFHHRCCVLVVHPNIWVMFFDGCHGLVVILKVRGTSLDAITLEVHPKLMVWQ